MTYLPVKPTGILDLEVFKNTISPNNEMPVFNTYTEQIYFEKCKNGANVKWRRNHIDKEF